MKKPMRKWTAGWVAIAFTWMATGIISPGQLKAGTAESKSTASMVEAEKEGNSETSSFEKEGPTPEIAKKKKSPWPYIVAGAFVVGIVVYFTLIKKKKHILVVETGAGVIGFPGAGKYTHKKGEKVAYNFTCADGYKNLIVFLDEKIVAASGTVGMDRAHSLRVEATKLSDYYLSVVYMDEVITGSPERGTYLYREGTTVPYHYAVADLALAAKLDGIPAPLPGSLIMDKNHVLEVSFGPPPDIRGKWRIKLTEANETQAKPKLDFIFSGTKKIGAVEVQKDSNIAYWSNWIWETGNYEVTSIQIKMELYVEEENNDYWFYSFLGNFTSSKNLKGLYHYEGSGDPFYAEGSGTWTATRIE